MVILFCHEEGGKLELMDFPLAERTYLESASRKNGTSGLSTPL